MVALLFTGACHAAEVAPATRPEPVVTRPRSDVLVPERICHVEESPSRVLLCAYPDDPSWPREILNRFLGAFHPDRLTRREDGTIEIREYGRPEHEYESVVLLRAGEADDGIRIEVGTPRGVGPELAQECIAALRFVFRFGGVRATCGPSTGCLLPMPPEGAPDHDWTAAADAEFAAIGLVRLKRLEAAGAGVLFYGQSGGEPEWHADLDCCEGVTLEVFHEVSPMDVEGERAMLYRILRRATGLDYRE